MYIDTKGSGTRFSYNSYAIPAFEDIHRANHASLKFKENIKKN